MDDYLSRDLHTPLGDLLFLIKNNRLVFCRWENKGKAKDLISRFKEKSTDASLKTITIYKPDPKVSPLRFGSNLEASFEIDRQLKAYFRGELKEFSIPLVLYGTDFQLKVWNEISKIPYGSTVSYADIARRIGNPKAVRAVAQACGKNPISIIIPCHRVVGSNGSTGGYNWGIDCKLALLNLEKPRDRKLL